VAPSAPPSARDHAKIFVLALFVVTLVGAALLALPWTTASRQGTAPIDALFTAVSAVSTTGLSVVDTFDYWNWWGQLMVLALIQVGGLSFTVGASIFLLMLRRGPAAYTLRDELLLKDGAPALSLQEAVSLGGRIIRFTLVEEGIGAAALALWFVLVAGLTPLDALWHGLFYAVAAYCNAGFSLLTGLHGSHPVATDPWVNIVLMLLIQAGAISYITLADAARARRWSALTLDAKLVLSVNAVLLAGGVLVLLAAEWRTTLAGLSPAGKILAASFQSVSARTAGFNTIDWSLANPLVLFFWLGIMFVGGAAGSTAGGVSLNTVGVVAAAVASTMRGNPDAQVWGRRIATPLVFRAVTLLVLFALIFSLGAVALAAAEHHFAGHDVAMIDLMFEAMSALSTTGVSTGITPHLTTDGKLILCLLMFVGRLGPLTAVYALQRRQKPERFRYPEEAVRIG
jgi:trk system potassium uptake protein TrkH